MVWWGRPQHERIIFRFSKPGKLAPTCATSKFGAHEATCGASHRAVEPSSQKPPRASIFTFAELGRLPGQDVEQETGGGRRGHIAKARDHQHRHCYSCSWDRDTQHISNPASDLTFAPPMVQPGYDETPEQLPGPPSCSFELF